MGQLARIGLPPNPEQEVAIERSFCSLPAGESDSHRCSRNNIRVCACVCGVQSTEFVTFGGNIFEILLIISPTLTTASVAPLLVGLVLWTVSRVFWRYFLF